MSNATFTATNRNNLRQSIGQSVAFLSIEDVKGYEPWEGVLSLGTELEEDDTVYEVTSIYYDDKAGGVTARCRWAYDKNCDSAIEANDFGMEE